MKWRLVGVAAACAILSAGPASAQDRPATLATLFDDIFGPRGLVVASEDVQVDGTNHAAHFNSAFQSDFRLVNIALTSQLAAIPLPSPASGFTYRFDAATGTFQRSTRSFGPILADRAETIGKGRLAFGFSHQFFSFDHLDGVPLAAVPAVFTHDDFESGGGRSDVVGTVNTIKADVSQFSGALTYGVTDRFDVSLAVPVVRTSLSLLSNATIHRVGTGDANAQVHYFPDANAIDGFGSTHQFYAEGTATGLGDLVFRAKGTIFREGPRALAAGLDVRLPTGDERNLLGSGAAGLRPFAAFSTSFGPVAPHVNIAYQWNGESVIAGDVETGLEADLPDRFSFAVGADYGLTDRLSIVGNLTGQRVLDSSRLRLRDTTATGLNGSVTLPDLRFESASYWVSSGDLGFKANLAPKLLITFNMRFAIGENGLADRVAPLLGFEWGF
jgi:hypothetical protein